MTIDLAALTTALLAKRGQDYFSEFEAWANGVAALNGESGSLFIATSTTSVEVGTGSKSFTLVETGRAYAAGSLLRVSRTSNAAVYMTGTVTSYSGTSLVLNVTDTGGSGTYDDWTVTVSLDSDLFARGAASSTDDAIVRFDGTTGKSLQNSGVRITDNGAVYGAAARVNNIGSTGSTVTCDFSAYNVWIFEPTGNLTVDVTNIPALTAGTVIGYLIVTGGGDHTLTLTAEGGAGTVLTEGGAGLELGTSTQVDIVGILQTGTDTVWLKVLNAEALS